MTRFMNGPSLASNPEDAFVHLYTPGHPFVAYEDWIRVDSEADAEVARILAAQATADAGRNAVASAVEVKTELL